MLAQDQSHNALVARYALQTGQIPLVGPFSSAGPFQTGGEWYWLVMISTAIYPFSVITPWIMSVVLSLVFVLLILHVGRELIDRKFGLILGILAAVSTTQLEQPANLTNQSPQAFFSLIVLWMSIKYIRNKRSKYLFVLGLCASLAATVHLQGAALFAIPIVTFLVVGLPSLRSLLYLAIGSFIPLVPLLIFDLQNDFVNSKGISSYYLVEQYRISYEMLGRRWLTYVLQFWPEQWSYIIGGFLAFGYIVPGLIVLATIYKAVTKKLSKEWLVMIISTGVMIVALRYVRTPIFTSYIMFLNPFVIILTGWIVYLTYKIKPYLAVILLILIVIGSLWNSKAALQGGLTHSYYESKYWEKVLEEKYPGQKFAIHDYKFDTDGRASSFALVLFVDGLVSDDGVKIGVAKGENKLGIVINKSFGYVIVDINEVKVEGDDWGFINPSRHYDASQNWYQNKSD